MEKEENKSMPLSEAVEIITKTVEEEEEEDERIEAKRHALLLLTSPDVWKAIRKRTQLVRLSQIVCHAPDSEYRLGRAIERALDPDIEIAPVELIRIVVRNRNKNTFYIVSEGIHRIAAARHTGEWAILAHVKGEYFIRDIAAFYIHEGCLWKYQRDRTQPGIAEMASLGPLSALEKAVLVGLGVANRD